jgi:hypothetical protein
MALKSQKQVQTAKGFRGGSLLPDRQWTFWTLTVWDSEADMRAYMTAGDHLRAMPKLVDWCDEASVVHWTQPEDALPSWQVASDRMRRDGRPSKIRHPAASHGAMAFAEPRTTTAAPIAVRRPA